MSTACHVELGVADRHRVAVARDDGELVREVLGLDGGLHGAVGELARSTRIGSRISQRCRKPSASGGFGRRRRDATSDGAGPRAAVLCAASASHRAAAAPSKRQRSTQRRSDEPFDDGHGVLNSQRCRSLSGSNARASACCCRRPRAPAAPVEFGIAFGITRYVPSASWSMRHSCSGAPVNAGSDDELARRRSPPARDRCRRS